MINKKLKYDGVVIPMITPVNEDFSIDSNSLALIMKTFTESEVSVFLLGTTGESTSVNEKDRNILVEETIKQAEGKIPVYAGVSSNCQHESIEMANHFAKMGVDAVVAHLPFYYPVKENKMVEYFKKIAERITCPLILYNNPTTVKQSMPLEIVEELSHHQNIVGFKDSERGIERLDKAIELWDNRDDFSFLLGWAAQSAYALSKGCNGIVPSTGNLTPALYKELYNAAINGDKQRADEIQTLTNNISEVYQKGRGINESIPALKVIMSEFGLCKPVALPPMFAPEAAEQDKLKEIIRGELEGFYQ